MRLYTFNNFYLSQIQIGIQTAHLVADMFVEYIDAFDDDVRCIEYHMLTAWADDYKTIICLNGGNAKDLHNIYNDLILLKTELQLPFTVFEEDEDSLNECITCVGIIVPEKIYNYDGENDFMSELSDAELKLYYMIKGKKLA